MTSTDFSPQSWTLRFKSRKTTILLHVDPLHTFCTIKSQLFTALEETGLKDSDGEIVPLPSSPSEIQLGRPININDAEQGFQLGEWEYTGQDDDEDEGKGKGKVKASGKARARKSDGGELATSSNVKDCPKGAGLKDGAVLAFRWVGDGAWDGTEDSADVDMDEDGGIISGHKATDMWAVKLASFEDAFGVENSADVGGRRQFEG